MIIVRFFGGKELGNWTLPFKMVVSGNAKGLTLAVLSSAFIGTNFILKKKGLKRAAAVAGTRAGEVFAFLMLFPDSMFCKEILKLK